MTYRTTAFAIIAGLILSGCVYDGSYYNAYNGQGYAGYPGYASSHGDYDDPEYCPPEDTYDPYARRSYRDDDYDYRYKKKKRLSKKERKRLEQHARDMEFLNEKLEQLKRWDARSAEAK